MKTDIKVVLFDLGRTILYPMHPWPEILFQADSALVNVFLDAGITSGDPLKPGEFQACLNSYYDQRNIDNLELTSLLVLKEFLTSKGYKNIPEYILRRALDAMYSVTQVNWYLEDDAHSSLTELSVLGYRLGLLSNASDDWDVQQLVDHWELRQHFDYILTSAAAGLRKPHPFMFQCALEFFAVNSSQVAMVGDTLTADIAGAENLGIYGIWLTRRALMPPDGDLIIQPQAIISSLKELPLLLKDIKSDS